MQAIPKNTPAGSLKNTKKILLSFVISMCGSLIAFFKLFGTSRDYPNYDAFFKLILRSGYGEIGRNMESDFELGFQYFIFLLSHIAVSSELIYTLIVFITLSAKIFIIADIYSRASVESKVYVGGLSLGIVMYLANFFPLYELTQIRQSLGMTFILISSFFLIFNPVKSLKYSTLKDKYRLAAFLILILISISFHSSMLLISLMSILAMRQHDRRGVLISSIMIFLISLLFFPIALNTISDSNISIRTDFYSMGNEGSTNPFSSLNITHVYTLLVCVLFMIIDFNNRVHTYCLSLLAYGIAIFYGTSISSVPLVYSARLYECLSVISPFLLASMTSKKQLLYVLPLVIWTMIWTINTFATKDFFF
jgi:EpsG family